MPGRDAVPSPPPSRAPVPRPVRALRWVLVGLLAVSAVLTLFGVPELRREVASGQWPKAALAGPPLVLALFVVGFAVYRVKLVRLGRYDPAKALIQIALLSLLLAVVAGMVLFPEGDVAGGRPVDLAQALRAGDPTTRALAAEVASHRPRADVLPLVPALVGLLDDPSAEVRRQAHAALVAIAGADLGGEGPGASQRWRDRLSR